MACGQGIYGEWGDGNITQNGIGVGNTPVNVNALTSIIAVCTGDNYSLFLKSDGTVWACGYNGYGNLGNGTTTQIFTPVQIAGLSGITAISAPSNGSGGRMSSLFLKNDGTVWACGDNSYGQLGDGTTVNRLTPV
jgi:alpha-tubulin suppressor-like RCC1 family protein